MSDELDSRGKPQSEYTDRFSYMDDAPFASDAEHRIEQSLYSKLNVASDYHWQVAACRVEAVKRGLTDLVKELDDCDAQVKTAQDAQAAEQARLAKMVADAQAAHEETMAAHFAAAPDAAKASGS